MVFGNNLANLRHRGAVDDGLPPLCGPVRLDMRHGGVPILGPTGLQPHAGGG
jgi:hypothetical protein